MPRNTKITSRVGSLLTYDEIRQHGYGVNKIGTTYLIYSPLGANHYILKEFKTEIELREYATKLIKNELR